jgi:predicted DNA-binding antitoxin AbrB/MazE fold protein
MSDHRQTIRALYKDGVLRPLEPLDLPDNTRVEVTVDPQGVLKRLDDLFARIHERNRDISLDEIERDVDRVIREIRAERRGGRDPLRCP